MSLVKFIYQKTKYLLALVMVQLFYKIILNKKYNNRSWLIVNNKTEAENAKNNEGNTDVFLETIEFNKQGKIQEIQSNEYTLIIDNDTKMSGLVFSILLQCQEYGEWIDSMFMTTNWVPIYVHLSEEGIPVKKGTEVQLKSRGDLSFYQNMK